MIKILLLSLLLIISCERKEETVDLQRNNEVQGENGALELALEENNDINDGEGAIEDDSLIDDTSNDDENDNAEDSNSSDLGEGEATDGEENEVDLSEGNNSYIVRDDGSPSISINNSECNSLQAPTTILHGNWGDIYYIMWSGAEGGTSYIVSIRNRELNQEVIRKRILSHRIWEGYTIGNSFTTFFEAEYNSYIGKELEFSVGTTKIGCATKWYKEGNISPAYETIIFSI